MMVVFACDFYVSRSILRRRVTLDCALKLPQVALEVK